MKQIFIIIYIVIFNISIVVAEDISLCKQGWLDKVSKFYEQALKNFNSCIEKGNLTESTLARTYRNIGITYHAKKEHKKAIEYYTKAINLHPKDIENDYLNRANAWDDAGDYKKALLDYNQSLRIVPDFPKVYSNMGLVYTRMGDDSKALYYFTKAYKFGLRSQNFYSNVNLFMVNKVRKDATIFLYSLKIFIKATSKYCQPLLHKNSNWSTNLINEWIEKHKKYLQASTKWLNTYFNSRIFYAKQIGLEKKEEVLNRMEKEAIIKMNNLVDNKFNKDIGIKECKQFEADISKGKYNITPKTQYYTELENLLPPVSSIVYEDIFQILAKEARKNK